MESELDPTQLAIEYLRRDKSALTPAEYLKNSNSSGWSSRICLRYRTRN